MANGEEASSLYRDDRTTLVASALQCTVLFGPLRETTTRIWTSQSSLLRKPEPGK